MAALPDKPRDHSFDGITEFDNPLPGWWLWIFYITIAFAAVYLPYQHWPGSERGQEANWRADVAAALAKYGSRDARFSVEELEELYVSGDFEAPGKELFIKNCARCHNEDGSGNIGPNMTDEYYLHGGALLDIASTITDGVPDKGMISWKNDLYPEQIKTLTCYIRSLRGNKVATPKPPQGWPCDEAGVPIPGATPVGLDTDTSNTP